MRLILLSLGLFAAAGPALVQPVMVPRDQTITRSVQAGQELRVITYARWHSDCSPNELPRIVIRTPPAHGSVSLRPGPVTVTSIRDRAYDCSGRTYDGIGIWYMPAPGFRGADQFDWNVVSPNSVSHDTALVQVR